jgi:hypothetical protein
VVANGHSRWPRRKFSRRADAGSETVTIAAGVGAGIATDAAHAVTASATTNIAAMMYQLAAFVNCVCKRTPEQRTYGVIVVVSGCWFTVVKFAIG